MAEIFGANFKNLRFFVYEPFLYKYPVSAFIFTVFRKVKITKKNIKGGS